MSKATPNPTAEQAIAAAAEEERIRLEIGKADAVADAQAADEADAAADEMAAFEAGEEAARLAAEATAGMEVKPGHVKVRVTALGHDKIATGETYGPSGAPFPKFQRGAEPPLPLDIAKELIAKGYVESVRK